MAPPTSRVRRRLAQRTREDVAFIVVAALVAIGFGFLAVAGILVAPLGFDESYVVQAAWNLATGNGYSTFDWQHGGGVRPFDTLLSTGPAVLLPVAAVFSVFGVGAVQLRVTMVAFLVLLAVVAFVFGRRIAGRWAGLATLVALLALDLRYDFPHTATWSLVDGLGELPAAAFLLLAALLVPRSRVAAGLVVGVAALCKLIAFLAVPAFVIAILLMPGSPVRRRLAGVLEFGACALAPSVLWEAVKLVSLGPAAYGESLRAYAAFILYSGSGIAPSDMSHDLVSRAGYLDGAFHLPPGGATLAMLVLAALSAIAVVGRRRREEAILGDPRFATVLAAGGIVLLFLIWWIAVSDSFFARHAFPGLLLAAPLLVAGGAAGVAELARGGRVSRVAAGTVFAVWLCVAGWQAAAHVSDAVTAPTYTRADQERVAAWLVDNASAGVQHTDYWQNPELRLLSGVDSQPYPTGTGPLVVSPQMVVLAPVLAEEALDRCGEILLEDAGFVVCDVAP